MYRIRKNWRNTLEDNPFFDITRLYRETHDFRLVWRIISDFGKRERNTADRIFFTCWASGILSNNGPNVTNSFQYQFKAEPSAHHNGKYFVQWTMRSVRQDSLCICVIPMASVRFFSLPRFRPKFTIQWVSMAFMHLWNERRCHISCSNNFLNYFTYATHRREYSVCEKCWTSPDLYLQLKKLHVSAKGNTCDSRNSGRFLCSSTCK